MEHADTEETVFIPEADEAAAAREKAVPLLRVGRVGLVVSGVVYDHARVERMLV